MFNFISFSTATHSDVRSDFDFSISWKNNIVDIAHILRKVRDRGYSQSANNNLTL